jgi:hypothetical protein
LRARCTGCDWVEATPPISALAASPCTMRTGTEWEVQVRLDQQLPATLAGLGPTEFTLSAELHNATLEPSLEGTRLRSLAEGGSGYVCCGATKSFIMPGVPATHAVAMRLNLTKGVVRTAFLKHGSCASPSDDVSGAQCTAPSCELAWLTVYDEFYGNMIHTYSEYLAVPWGATPWSYDPATTERRPGDWYVSIQALPGEAAEFEFDAFLLKPPLPPEVFECSRFSGFCPKRHYHAGLHASTAELARRHRDDQLFNLSNQRSGAGGRARRRPEGAAFAFGLGLVAAVLVLMTAARLR